MQPGLSYITALYFIVSTSALLIYSFTSIANKNKPYKLGFSIILSQLVMGFAALTLNHWSLLTWVIYAGVNCLSALYNVME